MRQPPGRPSEGNAEAQWPNEAGKKAWRFHSDPVPSSRHSSALPGRRNPNHAWQGAARRRNPRRDTAHRVPSSPHPSLLSRLSSLLSSPSPHASRLTPHASPRHRLSSLLYRLSSILSPPLSPHSSLFTPHFFFIPLRATAFFLLAVVLFCASPAAAKLAVFVDGRVLHVTDARATDGHIVLLLPGGGSLTVPATRVDRVIEDEVPEENAPPLPKGTGCNWKWQGQQLAPSVPYRAEITAAARSTGLNPRLLAALVHAESNFDPRARSRAGAKGLTQLMPAAALDHGVRDVWNPAENLRGGAEHLRLYLDRFHSLALALAAYNAGAATVERAGGVPPYRETRQFVRRILAELCPEPEPDPATRGGRLHSQGGSSP